MDSTLSFSCSQSDAPLSLSRQETALSNLDSFLPHNLVIWTDSYVPFPVGEDGYGVLPTAHFAAMRPLFPFGQAQFAQVFLLKPAPFWKLFTGLGSPNDSAIFLLLLPYPRHSALSSVFPFTSNSLADLAETVFCLHQYYQATISPRH